MSDSPTCQRVLVTGAGTGIGRGIAAAFARNGARVAVHCSSSTTGAEALVAAIRAQGGTAEIFKADFSQTASLPGLIEASTAFLGGLDVLVNNAGITMNRPFAQTTIDQFDRLYAVNVKAPYFLTQAALPHLLASRGVVINISSIHAYEGYVEHSVYAGTRGAVVSFTRQLAIELGPKGVKVVGIAPGAVPVDNHFALSGTTDRDGVMQAVGRSIPCGFAGTPEDIGAVAVFLASPGSRYLVGQTLIVDGGTTSWMPFGEQFKEPMTLQFGRGYVPGL